VLANAQRTSAGKNFLLSIGNRRFAPLLALLAAFQHFAFLPTTLLWQTGDLPNISVRTVPAIFYAPHFYTLFSAISRFWGDKINNILE
jgi:hypothetical protein